MSVVQVFGFTPDPSIGEVPFTSYVYNIFLNEKGQPRFLIWHPFANKWEVVSGAACRPLAVPPQELRTKKSMEAYHKLVIERQKNEKVNNLSGGTD